MQLVITISKIQKHTIVDSKGNKKEVPNSYLWLELDSGVRVLIQAVKKEDVRLLKSHARVIR